VGLSNFKIAELLGFSVAVVKSRFHRAWHPTGCNEHRSPVFKRIETDRDGGGTCAPGRGATS